MTARVLPTLVVTAIALRDRRALNAGEVAALHATGGDRARQGVPIELVLQAVRTNLSAIWEISRDRGRELGADDATILGAHEHLWSLADQAADAFTAGHREAELQLVRHEHQHRVDLVRALLLGRRAPDEVAAQIVSLGADADRAYVVCRGRAAQGATPAALEQVLVAGDPDAVLVGLEDDVIGVLTAAPSGALPGAVGISEPLPVRHAADGFRHATRALAAALHFRLTGAHTLPSVGVRAIVPADHELGDALEQRFLAPLRSGSPFLRELERTLAAYFECGLRLEATARRLHLHPNTLRKRLARYRALTGADLDSLPDRFGIWWALQRRPPS